MRVGRVVKYIYIYTADVFVFQFVIGADGVCGVVYIYISSVGE